MGVLLPIGTDADQRNWVIRELRKTGVESSRLSYALHLTPALKGFGPVRGTIGGSSPISTDIAARGIALPLYPGLTASEQDQVINHLATVVHSLAKQ